MTSGQPASTPAPTLTVAVAGDSHTLHAAAGVAIIGSDGAATVRIDDDRIARWHVRLEPYRDGWQAIDTSANGMFVDGVRRSSVHLTGPTTLCLGSADGVAVRVSPGGPFEAITDESTQVVDPFAGDQEQWWNGDIDPGVLRAGRAVADRRTELELTQRGLAKDKIINAGTLIAFEKGRSWPRRDTQARLEKALGWSPGTIVRIRNEAHRTPGGAATPAAGPAPSDEATEVLTDSVRAPLMAETVELAMHTLTAAMADLPDPSDPGFTPKATTILADLRKLEKLASSAARHATGAPSVVLALSSVRRSYNDLMLRAARSPAATVGQRLYEARHRAELSLQETANGAGLPASVLEDAEAERAIPPEAATAIETLVAQLTIH